MRVDEENNRERIPIANIAASPRKNQVLPEIQTISVKATITYSMLKLDCMENPYVAGTRKCTFAQLLKSWDYRLIANCKH